MNILAAENPSADLHTPLLTERSQQTRDVVPMPVQCWASVADNGPPALGTTSRAH